MNIKTLLTPPGPAAAGKTFRRSALLALAMAGLLSGPAATAADAWKHLFDGKTLEGWKVAEFGGRGEVTVQEGELRLEMGAMLTGSAYTNAVPRIDYEVALEAKRVMGSDFFCGLTVPYQTTNCTLIVGGWGGGVVGISSLDYYDASENETTTFRSFGRDQWYDIRMRVTADKLQVWIDNERVINVSLKDRQVGMRPGEIELCVPLGIAAYQTTAALRNIRVRPVAGPAE
jgi:hypothetical protein